MVENRQDEPVAARHDTLDRTAWLTEENARDGSSMSGRACEIRTLAWCLQLLERSTGEARMRTVNWTIYYRYPDAPVAS